MRGWDVLREERHARMKRIGLINGKRWTFTERSLVPVDRDDIADGFPGQPNPPWESIDEPGKKDLAHRMSLFAAMVEHVDLGVRKIVEHFKETGEFDSTLIMLLSDNSACYEWGPHGFDERSRPGRHDFAHGRRPPQSGKPSCALASPPVTQLRHQPQSSVSHTHT